ncbi:hypothetical protein RhiirA5_426195 [Rhizophagus irregularis]|uniref:Uncharacterized protein n=1 Tax=Rhizophagus irregularis TaxID=588596 RepID=A0A2I1FB85_9GLOM|nr:hypothetical protein RhiirA5_426195 [Rhizophagus irregularis]PKC61809.1 hypothetical protein RhiirA1_466010 [Rhizophagus irregularis]PKY31623.1 hypothetical protein RhiirB3_449320 [Rhizophagus irregularis]
MVALPETSSFHAHYSKQLNQLPNSIKIYVWKRLTARKRPLTLEQASGIHPEVEVLLNKAVEDYSRKKERQRMKCNEHNVSANSECEDSLKRCERENDSLRQTVQEMEKRLEESREMVKSLNYIISAKDRKIVYLADQILYYTQYDDPTIEPYEFSSTYERDLWKKHRSESIHDPKIRRRFSFRGKMELPNDFTPQNT